MIKSGFPAFRRRFCPVPSRACPAFVRYCPDTVRPVGMLPPLPASRVLFMTILDLEPLFVGRIEQAPPAALDDRILKAIFSWRRARRSGRCSCEPKGMIFSRNRLLNCGGACARPCPTPSLRKPQLLSAWCRLGPSRGRSTSREGSSPGHLSHYPPLRGTVYTGPVMDSSRSCAW